MRGVCGLESQLASVSPEFLDDLDIQSNIFNDHAFRKIFKTYQTCSQDSENRIQKWIEPFYMELFTYHEDVVLQRHDVVEPEQINTEKLLDENVDMPNSQPEVQQKRHSLIDNGNHKS